MIYIELNERSFAYELSKDKDNWFSYEGAKALYNHFNDCGFDIEFDAVALYNEYTKTELVENYLYSAEVEDIEDEDEKIEAVMQYIEDNTILIKIDDDNYIIQDF